VAGLVLPSIDTKKFDTSSLATCKDGYCWVITTVPGQLVFRFLRTLLHAVSNIILVEAVRAHGLCDPNPKSLFWWQAAAADLRDAAMPNSRNIHSFFFMCTE
jgi:hypothetical protein